MQTTTKTFTVAMGADLPQAAALGFPCVDLIYTFQNGRLYRYGQPSPPGALLGLYPTEPLPDAAAAARMLEHQVYTCRYAGVLLDLPEDPHGMSAAACLSPRLTARGIPVYLPISLFHADPKAFYILPSAISGGSLAGMLDHFTALSPPDRLCLELVRTRHDFSIPSADPGGSRLRQDDFLRLRADAGGSCFSPALCANYFTYKDAAGKPRLVLFDDTDTAREKLRLSRQYGLRAVFALYAEWGSEIKQIFAP